MPHLELLPLLAQASSNTADKIDPELANATIELLKEQIKALGEANRTLKDTFVAFASIVSAAGVFSMFAVFDAVRKAREDAQIEVKTAVKDELRTAIDREIETLPKKIDESVDTQIQNATRYLKRLVEPESQLQKTKVAYWIPGETNPDQIQTLSGYELIADRKFLINPLTIRPEIQHDADTNILTKADIVIVDLINYDAIAAAAIDWRTSTEKTDNADNPEEKPTIVALLEWLCRHHRRLNTASDLNVTLVIYAPPGTRELNAFMNASSRGSKSGTPYYTPANNLVSLLANTIDAASVVYATSSIKR